MRRAIDIPNIWRQTLKSLDQDLQDMALLPPAFGPCSFQLDDLLSEIFDVDVALTQMAARQTT